jgi:hypothetical protein
MNIDSGTVVASINKALTPSNTTFTVTGIVTNGTGNTLHLYYVGGPVLVPGDKFHIFNRAVTNGAGMAIVASGFSVANHLADDGSVTVITASPLITQLTNTFSAAAMNLSWDPAWVGGVHLQGQTNQSPNGLRTTWGDIAGTSIIKAYTNSINKTNGSVFFRLAIP